jgi:hypothetical protein
MKQLIMFVFIPARKRGCDVSYPIFTYGTLAAPQCSAVSEKITTAFSLLQVIHMPWIINYIFKCLFTGSDERRTDKNKSASKQFWIDSNQVMISGSLVGNISWRHRLYDYNTETVVMLLILGSVGIIKHI